MPAAHAGRRRGVNVHLVRVSRFPATDSSTRAGRHYCILHDEDPGFCLTCRSTIAGLSACHLAQCNATSSKNLANGAEFERFSGRDGFQGLRPIGTGPGKDQGGKEPIQTRTAAMRPRILSSEHNRNQNPTTHPHRQGMQTHARSQLPVRSIGRWKCTL